MGDDDSGGALDRLQLRTANLLKGEGRPMAPRLTGYDAYVERKLQDPAFAVEYEAARAEIAELDANLLIFDVEGHLPPKKDGATSMWNKRAELPRIVALRQAAAAAFGERPPFDGRTALSLVVHIASNTRATGDLDNFVTGVCDALQCCAPRAALAPAWEAQELAEIHPRHVVALVDDMHIIEINARKVVTPALKAPRYRVELRRLEQK